MKLVIANRDSGVICVIRKILRCRTSVIVIRKIKIAKKELLRGAFIRMCYSSGLDCDSNWISLLS